MHCARFELGETVGISEGSLVVRAALVGITLVVSLVGEVVGTSVGKIVGSEVGSEVGKVVGSDDRELFPWNTVIIFLMAL